MQLVKLTLSGFRRFLHAEAQLHGRLMALVGPNEAGKSSLLAALEHLNTSNRFDASDLSHEQEYSDDATILRARFLLDDSDRAAIRHLPGGDDARWFVVAKRRGGQIATAVEPALELDLRERRTLSGAVARLQATRWGSSLPDADPEDIGSRLRSVASMLQGDDVLNPEARTAIDSLGEALRSDEDLPRSGAKVAESLGKLLKSEPTEHPQAEARRVLVDRRPLFLKFTQAHRDLQYMYELEGMDLDNPPVALSNLGVLAGLNLQQVLLAVQAGDYAAPERPIEEANLALAQFFRDSWTNLVLRSV